MIKAVSLKVEKSEILMVFQVGAKEMYLDEKQVKELKKSISAQEKQIKVIIDYAEAKYGINAKGGGTDEPGP